MTLTRPNQIFITRELHHALRIIAKRRSTETRLVTPDDVAMEMLEAAAMCQPTTMEVIGFVREQADREQSFINQKP